MWNVFLYMLYLCRDIDKYTIMCYALPQRTLTCLAFMVMPVRPKAKHFSRSPSGFCVLMRSSS